MAIKHSKKKLTHFATKSSKIIISSRRAGSTLQKRSLLYKTQKKTKSKRKKKTFFFCFFDFVDDVDVLVQGLYGIQITTNKFCIARMYSCMCGVFILKKIHKQKLEKLLKKLVETPFFFFAL
jgi:TRAP-type C4-dicarboxylate transport system permease large subunit